MQWPDVWKTHRLTPSAITEMTAASMGALVCGVTLGSEELTMSAFGTAMLACAIMSCGYLILIPLISRGLGKPLQRIFSAGEDGKNRSFLSFSVPYSPCCSFLCLHPP